MAETSRSVHVRDMAPRTHLKLMRNHFANGAESALCGSLSGFDIGRGVTITPTTNALSAELWASQRTQAYRFGWINAVFNPRKVLLGDDPDALERGDGRIREWL